MISFLTIREKGRNSETCWIKPFFEKCIEKNINWNLIIKQKKEEWNEFLKKSEYWHKQINTNLTIKIEKEKKRIQIQIRRIKLSSRFKKQKT